MSLPTACRQCSVLIDWLKIWIKACTKLLYCYVQLFLFIPSANCAAVVQDNRGKTVQQ